MAAFFRSLLAVIIGFFICIVLIVIFLAAIAAGSRKVVTVKNNSILELKLDKQIPERPVDNPLAGIPFFSEDAEKTLSLKEILDDIKYAKEDSKIKGIYIETGFGQQGLSTLEEIRNALIDFKKSGKFIYAYAELYTQKSYYIASVADSVFINPNGVFSFSGFHSEQLFLKGLLDKLEIKPILIRGTGNKYKSAGETFTRSDMSDPNRQQLTDFMNSAYDDYLAKIGLARHIDPAQLKSMADNLTVKLPSDAVKYKLVDRAIYKDDVLKSLRQRLNVNKDDDINCMEISKYDDAEHINKKTGPKIALIYAVGEIAAGGEGSEDEIGSDKLSKTIREAREDDDIKAIVLRVNSPGGSALASDVIWREVALAKLKKPVIASFGDVAASGGYYIAAPADMIIAEPNSVTGSIGVFGLLPGLKAFWNDKLGITWDRVKTGKYADIGNPNRDMTPEEEAIIQNLIDTTYRQFKNRVSTGRHLSSTFVDSIAQGHVYSGIQAKKLGLVDQLGNMDDAIAMAAKEANLTSYSLKVLPYYKVSYVKALREMGGAEESMMQKELGSNYEIFKELAAASHLQGVLMYCPYTLDIQ